jgi:hypothetical protein
MIREMIRVTKCRGTLLVEFCKSWRPFRNQRPTVRLSVIDVRRIIKEYPPISIVETRGVLIFSATLFEMVPEILLPVFEQIDRICSRIIPQFAARCYVTLKKRSTIKEQEIKTSSQ